jgi:hypothetical protein
MWLFGWWVWRAVLDPRRCPPLNRVIRLAFYTIVFGGRSCSCGVVHQGISRSVLRGTTCDPGHWTFYFCRRGFGLMVGVVVPLMLAVLPYARGRGFESLSRLHSIWRKGNWQRWIRCFLTDTKWQKQQAVTVFCGVYLFWRYPGRICRIFLIPMLCTPYVKTWLFK